MGWITDRRMRSGKGIGGYREKGKGDAPLKKIVQILSNANGLFDQNRVLLECGHTTKSNGNVRARCKQCKEEAQQLINKNKIY